MANIFTPLEKVALLYLASYVADNKPKILAAIVQPVTYGLDQLVHFIKNAEPHSGLAALLDGAINSFLDNVEKSILANAPTEAGAIVDYIAAEITTFANALPA
jgi:hypothetical protein